jgi:Zn-dependent protease
MLPTKQGAMRLFRAFGIDVYLHWSWFILVLIELQSPQFPTYFWSFVALFTIFAIVLLHEFGHALACRSVGGKADTIMLWPLGGVAYVQPPQRPGAILWSIVAGPLVNVVLVPVTILGYFAATRWIPGVNPDLQLWTLRTMQLNLALLIFNMLPIYPLDGGQTLQAILWFIIGRPRSLRLVAGIGVVVAIVAGIWAVTVGHTMLVFVAVFVGMRAAEGYRMAIMMSRMQAAGYRIEE